MQTTWLFSVTPGISTWVVYLLGGWYIGSLVTPGLGGISVPPGIATLGDIYLLLAGMVYRFLNRCLLVGGLWLLVSGLLSAVEFLD